MAPLAGASRSAITPGPNTIETRVGSEAVEQSALSHENRKDDKSRTRKGSTERCGAEQGAVRDRRGNSMVLQGGCEDLEQVLLIGRAPHSARIGLVHR